MALAKTAIKITSPAELEKIRAYYEKIKDFQARMKAQTERHEEELKPIRQRIALENDALLNEYNTAMVPFFIETLKDYVANPLQHYETGEYSIDFGYLETFGDAYIVHHSKDAGPDSFKKEKQAKTSIPTPPSKLLN